MHMSFSVHCYLSLFFPCTLLFLCWWHLTFLSWPSGTCSNLSLSRTYYYSLPFTSLGPGPLLTPLCSVTHLWHFTFLLPSTCALLFLSPALLLLPPTPTLPSTHLKPADSLSEPYQITCWPGSHKSVHTQLQKLEQAEWYQTPFEHRLSGRHCCLYCQENNLIK